mmetsp:Transcript_97548/g.176230  ORF Transcript_97548/g.176230 Transcript_97548/m.176230 type:complete len:667 (+) Transcript_97548:47-2047(+)
MAPIGRAMAPFRGKSASAKALAQLGTSKSKGRPSGKGRGSKLPFEPDSVLQSTSMAAKAKLVYQSRCEACHGRTVRDVLASMAEPGTAYRMADLKYDIKLGRLDVLKPGTSAGPLPVGKDRAPAPLAGKPMPPANLEEFFQFLQGQLRKETIEHCPGQDVELTGVGAQKMWPDIEAFVAPNLGLTERWVPYHTVLGVHELFLIQQVHTRSEWNEKQKFVAMFIFRSHCKRDLFLKAQLPLMLKKDFWQDPAKAFRPGGPMERSILDYRKKTGQPLLTSCFRIIPPRVLKDDTENLVRSITHRTQNLIEVAEHAFPIVKDKTRTSLQKMSEISTRIQSTDGLGETWAKMLTVCIDLAYPKERFLESQCDVGTGAAPPLKCLLPKGGPADKKEALQELLKIVNKAKCTHSKHFWDTLKNVEQILRTKFKSLPGVCDQANTKMYGMPAVTLQVQLCEYRQFRHSIARLKYGLADDETMRVLDMSTRKPQPEDFLVFDKKTNSVTFQLPKDGKQIDFSVSVKAAKSQKIAERVAAMCFVTMRDGGAAKADAAKLRDEFLDGYLGGEDVPADSEAWHACRISLTHSSPLVSWQYEDKAGKKLPFQTTKAAAGGCLQAERVARLCWVKLQAGGTKEAVQEYRNKLYKQLQPNGPKPRADFNGPPAKRQKVAK